MKKIILILAIVVMSLVACSPKVTSPDSYSSHILTETIGTQAIKAHKMSLDRPGFNNICKDEGISSELGSWAQAAFKTYESHKAVVEYYFIKEDSVPTTVYRLDLDIVGRDTTFVLEIRNIISAK